MNFVHRGINFVIDTYSEVDHISKIIHSTSSFYEYDLLEYMKCIIGDMHENTLILDVGANIGNHSIYFSNFVADKVIAVEPNPAVLPLLRRNLQANPGKWAIVEQAVGEMSGYCRIASPPAGVENIGMARIESAPGDCSGISLTTIDKIIEQYAKTANTKVILLAIKIDIEGMELQALKGAPITLVNFQPDLFIEAQDAETLSKLSIFLAPFGYRRISKWAATPVYHFSSKQVVYKYICAVVHKLYSRTRKALKRLALG